MKKRYILLLILVAAVLLLLAATDARLAVRTYRVSAPGLGEPVRLALVTDLHSCKWGENQQTLLAALEQQKPDVVLLGGDIFDDRLPNARAEVFLKAAAAKFPCYYVTGNHEYWSDTFAEQMKIVEKCGVTRLNDQAVTVTVGNVAFNLCGLDDPEGTRLSGNPGGAPPFSQRLEDLAKIGENGLFTVLLAHRPESFPAYVRYDFDLVLSGHAHGGQWRIPGLLNGLLAPDQGLFPKYAGGRYEENGTTMIVSRGLARESTPVPRIFNRPELVIVELEP